MSDQLNGERASRDVRSTPTRREAAELLEATAIGLEPGYLREREVDMILTDPDHARIVAFQARRCTHPAWTGEGDTIPRNRYDGTSPGLRAILQAQEILEIEP